MMPPNAMAKRLSCIPVIQANPIQSTLRTTADTSAAEIAFPRFPIGFLHTTHLPGSEL